MISVFVETIKFVNVAPMGDLCLHFVRGVNVLSGVNGRGKTTILSYIVDALYEIAKKEFSQSFEGKENFYYRISSSSELLDYEKPGIIMIRFMVDNEVIDYINIRGAITKEVYEGIKIPHFSIDYSNISSALRSQNNCKIVHPVKRELFQRMFSESIATYFPAYRYEVPAYLNSPYKPSEHFFNDVRYSGYLPNRIEVVTGINDIANWILDVVLDWEVKNSNLSEEERKNSKIKERTIWQNMCNVLGYALLAKRKNNFIRFGIGSRSNNTARVSIISESQDNKFSNRVAPSLQSLSSGEQELLGLFGEIMRQADVVSPNVLSTEIQGLVLVDEIDKHLHIKSQKEALPQLLNSFPGVQFIVASHSPFLNMGLADDCRLQCRIFDLDNQGLECEPRNNELYQQVYTMMLGDQSNLTMQIEQLKRKLSELTKPLIITEGSTDIQHILKAKEKLHISLDFDVIDTSNQPSGESELDNILKYTAKTNHPYPIIGIFDCDTNKSKHIGVPYMDFGNNVYAFKIVPPQSRIDKGQNNISIEYLYSDDEIHTRLSNNTQLFFGTDFNLKTGVCISDSSLILSHQQNRGIDKIVENTNGQAVYDYAEQNYLAKKTDFANAITHDEINISDESWQNFKHIFDTISLILNNQSRPS